MTGAFWGADAGELEALARRLQAVASELEGIGGSLGSTLAATTWQGPDAELFQSDWHGVHARAVTGAAEVLRQAATKLDFEARQQLNASGSSGSTGGSSQPSGVVRRIEGISGRWGWAIGPIVAKIPGVGTAQLVDQGFRIGQDATKRYYQLAFNEATTDAAPIAMDFGPVGVFGGVDMLIGKAAEHAARQIDWNYTFHHLSEFGQLFSPSVWPSIGQAEASGFKSLGIDVGEAVYSAIVSKL